MAFPVLPQAQSARATRAWALLPAGRAIPPARLRLGGELNDADSRTGVRHTGSTETPGQQSGAGGGTQALHRAVASRTRQLGHASRAQGTKITVQTLGVSQKRASKIHFT